MFNKNNVMKNIYQITEDVSFKSGGVRTVLVNLDDYINSKNTYKSTILTNFKEKNDPYLVFKPSNLKIWNFSKNYQKYLNSKINEIDVLHLHGVFMHPQFSSSKLALQNNVPFIISPHGMLEPWHLNDKRRKKELYLKFFLQKMLSKSNLLHAITPLEKENLFKLTNHKNIFEIPNFIYHSKIPKNINYSPSEEYFLFLGRIHPKKGLDILIKSMMKMENKKIKLKIVGELNQYSNELKNICTKLNLNKRVEFLGSVFGDEKYNLYSNAKAFVAPSYTEAIGMVNLEAAVCKTPVITTYNTGINPNWNLNGGIMINPNTQELTLALNDASNWSQKERNERGILLSTYVINNYSWEQKGHLWTEAYSSLKR